MDKFLLVLWLMVMAGFLGYGIGRFRVQPRIQSLDIKRLDDNETLLLFHKGLLSNKQREQLLEGLARIEKDPRRVFILDGNFRAVRMNKGVPVDLFPENGK
jgi:hypothetical protein